MRPTSGDPSDDEAVRRDGSSRQPQEQTELLIAYGHDLERLPPTCDLGVKTARLQHWLAQRGIRYPG
ncbi:hypothetical protein CKO25_08245 [Thiocapsa imhoffii]|uniref:Uncharacterized protein n=1 Tax=Thiocapsa imhoffii TaxID=382777 RepID=A0A9X0WH71_9GAMM|nr:hypothetical protein [Thiocapsa imhoffii]MBK1644639.1 hypothetical protein [Thiocapsa imhoffii]